MNIKLRKFVVVILSSQQTHVTCNVYVSCNFLLNNITVTRVLCNSYIEIILQITNNCRDLNCKILNSNIEIHKSLRRFMNLIGLL